MKKYLVSLAILVASSLNAKAQFTLGVKGGLNISQINTDNLTQSSVAGYQVGAWARIGKGFYVQPELYLSGKGGKFDFVTSNTTKESGTLRFTTLDVPVLVGESFGTSHLNIRVMAGPMYSYILNSSDNFSANIKNAYADFGNYNNSTLGYQAGVGVDLGMISVDARYEGGLTKINEKYGQRENLFHLSLGFKIL